ncbi:MAG: hypothetical protein P8171_05145 [Candidatus Thiodiazotropha sp.]|jgi:hypothetical protein
MSFINHISNIQNSSLSGSFSTEPAQASTCDLDWFSESASAGMEGMITLPDTLSNQSLSVSELSNQILSFLGSPGI